MNKLQAIGLSLFLLIVLLVSLKEEPQNLETSPLSKSSKILAFGDSLTYGKGAPSQSYPTQLQQLINIEVINAGQSGEPSSRGLKRLPHLLKEHKPDLVILCHGGNDLLQKKSKDTLRTNLVKMIRLSKQSGAKVLLVGVPNFKLVGFSTEGLYEEIAEQEKIMYEGDILSKIENDSSLKSDRIHPNAKGYSLMAESFIEVLRENKLIN
ncbi:MAG: arylesterase [Arcobacter sp.]|nr:MAG: arylesterase [Arcobacter sp.]